MGDSPTGSGPKGPAKMDDFFLPTVISPLPDNYRDGLIAISVVSCLSLVTCTCLAIYLGYRIVARRRNRQPQNQLMILLFNLMLADIQQSIGFVLSLHWLRLDKLDGEDNACWTQGWFLGVGNVATAFFCLAIGVYTFVFMTFRYQLKTFGFYLTIALLWTVVYAMPLASVLATHNNWFMLGGPVCSMSIHHLSFQMWLHNFWIILPIGLTVILYILLCVILRIRVRNGVYARERASKAIAVSKISFLYPAVYIVCWVPLFSVPIAASHGIIPSIQHLSAGYGLWSCVGWLDVLLYTLTRRFDEAPKREADTPSEYSIASDWESIDPLDTFDFWLYPGKANYYGTTTTIEAGPVVKRRRRGFRNQSRNGTVGSTTPTGGVQTETTVNISNAPLPPDAVEGFSHADLRTFDLARGHGNAEEINFDDLDFKSGDEFLNA